MSIFGRMRTAVDIYERTAESDSWTLVEGDVKANIQQLSIDRGRQQSELLEMTVTHRIRLPLFSNNPFDTGQRVRESDSGDEYVVRVVREHKRPGPGHTVLTAAEAEPTIE